MMQLTELDLDRAIAANRSVFTSACTGDCNQGRLCTCQPAPAEAATEIGAEPAINDAGWFWSAYAAMVAVAIVASIAALA